MVTADQSVTTSSFYRFLALSMRYPDAQWMTADYFDTLLTVLAQLGGDTEESEIRTVLDDSQPSQLLEDLQVEYTRLFINSFPHVIAPPFASIYIDQTLQSTFTEQTHAFYKQKNYTVTDGSVPPDHLVTELEFLSLLAEKDDTAGEEAFLQGFFRPWFQQYHKRISSVACHPFYKVVTQLIDFFTKEDEEDGI